MFVFILIAIRQVGRFKLQIWQIMLFGALVVLISGQIRPLDAWKAINLDVILFLFGMFITGEALEQSGYLSHLSYKIFKRAKNLDHLLLLILFFMGAGSILLMNDTMAIIGTPVVLLLAKKHHIPYKPLLLTLAFAITIGSVTSPIGNPQNLLIALNGQINKIFIAFLKYLLLPTTINLLVAFLLIKIYYRQILYKQELDHSQEPIKDKKLAYLSKIALGLVISLIFIKITTYFIKVPFDFKLTHIALISCLPIILLSSKRWRVLRKIDYKTLIFFAAMFVLMQAVWNCGFFQNLINSMKLKLDSTPVIFGLSVLLSQLISNVPLVALYQPILMSLGASIKALMSLAAASTIAGNLFILGAASNVIIIQNTEKRDKHKTLTFWEFARIGIPLTIINVLIYWLYLTIIQ
ncbi:MAG: anion transporter [candidate division WOR-3 bacterium]